MLQRVASYTTRRKAELEPETRKPLTASQLRAARGLLGWSAAELAEAAGVSHATIKRAELAIGEMMPANEKAIRQALHKAGVELISENGGGEGVRLRRRRR
jgi:transcriptional regulator with XRE-family HTH domain